LSAADRQSCSLFEVMAVMAKLGTIAVGGPAVHVAMLRDETVNRRHWLDDREFLDLFGAVSVLPGPSSTQLAIVLGRRRAGWLGLVVGGACFIGPAMLIVLALAWTYSRYGTTPTGGGILYGVEPVVIAVVAVALWQLGRTALKRRWFLIIGAIAVAAYLTGINVLIPLAAGGLAVTVIDNRARFTGMHAWIPFLTGVTVTATATTHHPRPRALSVLAEFSKLGVVVFGSGYVLLAFLRADLVTHLHWLTERQLLDAVAAGQITPGPVFTTATFVGYLVGGTPSALLATAGIFVPSFLMVAALEPFVRRIRRSIWLGPALDGITVAALGPMVGVALDLGRTAIIDPFTAILAVVALAVLLRWNPNGLWLVLTAAVIGVLHLHV
jgi:chromate transporter